jgi:hypothetical protein
MAGFWSCSKRDDPWASGIRFQLPPKGSKPHTPQGNKTSTRPCLTEATCNLGRLWWCGSHGTVWEGMISWLLRQPIRGTTAPPSRPLGTSRDHPSTIAMQHAKLSDPHPSADLCDSVYRPPPGAEGFMRWNLGFVVAISNKRRPCVALSRRHTWEWLHLVAKFVSRLPVWPFHEEMPEIVPSPYLPGATGHGHMLDWSVAPLPCGVNGIDLACMHDRIKDTGHTGELTPPVQLPQFKTCSRPSPPRLAPRPRASGPHPSGHERRCPVSPGAIYTGKTTSHPHTSFDGYETTPRHGRAARCRSHLLIIGPSRHPTAGLGVAQPGFRSFRS